MPGPCYSKFLSSLSLLQFRTLRRSPSDQIQGRRYYSFSSFLFSISPWSNLIASLSISISSIGAPLRRTWLYRIVFLVRMSSKSEVGSDLYSKSICTDLYYDGLRDEGSLNV